ncbi:MAG: ChbG/HpnK family deacetylase [Candidatus Omnitrophota bacterium]
MKSLIINADDVGFSDAINEAAKECFLAGSITGVSLMTRGARFDEAASMLREIGKKDAGVHLTLTGPCGTFAESYRDLAMRYFLGKVDLDEIYAELSGQIKKVRDAGLEVTHLDGHEHVHMFPDILRLTIRLAKEYGVPYIRFPLEVSSIMMKSFSLKDLVRHFSLAAFIPVGKKCLQASGLKCNEYFFGHFHAGRIDSEVFRFMLDNLREGVTELAVHPSVRSESFYRESPWYKNTGEEFNALIEKGWKELLPALGILLVPHKKVIF